MGVYDCFVQQGYGHHKNEDISLGKCKTSSIGTNGYVTIYVRPPQGKTVYSSRIKVHAACLEVGYFFPKRRKYQNRKSLCQSRSVGSSDIHITSGGDGGGGRS